ncbi:hypothetical protein NEIELOOT_02627 [Neisseria elongata subsp. glycolytica ATCC 29315]|uniref:Uncharacterized protein n=1 Tax=Neisseria elongata subsp. glycolytica ATCC 29315 TaxID=546263 RepID=D4DU71_NEIEG|nr:hypothetical protein NEIELOOT_02627 [Neisseria elongata subsp. glycolytica ATCC 29315]
MGLFGWSVIVGFSRRRFVFMDFMCGILIGIGSRNNQILR